MTEQEMQAITEKAAKIADAFDPEAVPWTTDLNDWTLCFNNTVTDYVWIENELINAIVAEQPQLQPIADPVEVFFDAFQELGRLVFKWLSTQTQFDLPDLMQKQEVVGLRASQSKINMRLGFFNEVKFLFRPRLGTERVN